MRVRWTALSVLTLACQSGGGAGAPLSEQDKNAIREQTTMFSDAVNAKDFAKASSQYADDAIFLVAYSPAVSGKANIQKWMEAFPTINSFKATSEEIEGHGDLAYNRGTYEMSVTMPGASAPTQDRGKWIEIVRKQADGSWKVVRDIFNSDLPPAMPPADAAKKP
jgi:ketosteroid isomerase-like protein